MDFILDTRERKTQVLRRGTFGCLRGIPSINVTMGCIIRCVYCYARGYPGTPGPGRVILFSNLAEKLKKELSRKREKIPLVLFNTASDSFQPHPDIINMSLNLIEMLLSQGISVSFLTKGIIPKRFFEMARDFSDLIFARIGINSVSPDYQKRFEPNAATPTERLENIRRLKQIGVKTDVRIDPIIPFVTERKDDFDALFGRLGELGIDKASVSYLHLRPAIMDQFKRELDPTNLRLIEGMFAGRGWETVGSATMSKMIPRELRVRGYLRAEESAERYGINLSVCSCKNPDIPGEICTPEIVSYRKVDKMSENQLQL